MIFLLNKYGFKVIDTSRIPNYAGSIRVTATLNKKIKPNKSVKRILNEEKKRGFYSENKYSQYSKKVINKKILISIKKSYKKLKFYFKQIELLKLTF